VAEMQEVRKFLGSKTAERMKATKWWAYARIIDHALYDGDIADKKKGLSMPAGIDIPGIDGASVDLCRVMRELAHECERMALLEVT
jgi:hypothetical protein